MSLTEKPIWVGSANSVDQAAEALPAPGAEQRLKINSDCFREWAIERPSAYARCTLKPVIDTAIFQPIV